METLCSKKLISFLVLGLLLWIRTTRGGEPAFEPIFDGSSLEKWNGDERYWKVAEGAITGSIPDGATLRENQFLFYEDDVHDFELELEFRISGDPSANSGIQFRSQQTENGAAGYQADLDDGATWLGRIYDEHGRALLVERGSRVSIAPDGRRWVDKFADPADFRALPRDKEWNSYRILATGPHVEIWINDRLCSMLDDHEVGAAEYSGKLALQLHSGPGPVTVQFRNIRLKHLGKTSFPTEPPAAFEKENRQTESPVLWHLRPNPNLPTDDENEQARSVVAKMMLTDGFQAELIAAEPEIHQPIAFAIDERGRLWIAEAFSYPNKQPAGEGKDRIRILEDRDGDGEFETQKTFTDGLNLVSGIEVGFGGVWIGAAPELLFIPDHNRDDVPDGPPQVLLDGWGYQDTHETLNSFTWGPDGWLYGNQGVFNAAQIGKPGAPESERVPLRAGIWRYHPTRHEFEIFAHGGSNQWGLDFNDAGHLFMTHCRSYWGGGGTTYVIRNGHYWNQTNSNHAPFISNSAPKEMPHLANYLPASAKYDSGEGGAGKPGTRAVYGGHSHVGTMFYLGDNWPAIYRNRLFTHNLHGHQINHQINVRQGSAYETFHAGFDLLYAPDPAYIPVDLQFGPDGAVYVIDWTDRQHCHNPRGETWDRSNGRVYRISWRNTFRPVNVNLADLSDAELVELQSHSNRWYGRTARRLLQERAASGKLDTKAEDSARALIEADEDEPTVLSGLWTLYVANRLTEKDLRVALSSKRDVVRAWAVQLATESNSSLPIPASTLTDLAANDPSPAVRLALAAALPALSDEYRWQVASALASHPEDAKDRFLPKLVWQGIAEKVADDPARAIELANSTPQPALADSILWYVANQPEGRERIADAIATATDAQEAARLLTLLSFGVKDRSTLERPRSWSLVQERFSDCKDIEVCSMTDELSALFGDESVLEKNRQVLADANSDLQDRRRALGILKRVADRKAAPIYAQLLNDADFRKEAIELVSTSADISVASKLIDGFSIFNEAEKNSALFALTSRSDFALALLDAVEKQDFDKGQITALHVRRMANMNSKEIDNQLEKMWGKIGSSSAEAQETIGKLKKTFTSAPLWAFDSNRGRKIFEKTCAACHPLDGIATPLGPSLNGSWRNGIDYFLENIIDPNAVVGESFRTTVVVTSSGTVVSGLLESESDATITIRGAEKTFTVSKDEVDERRLTDQSLMPTGLLDDLSEVETIELLKFLTTSKE